MAAQWREVPLEYVCTPGGIVRGPFGGSLKKEEFVGAGFQVYEQRHAINGTTGGARYFVTRKKYSTMSRFSVKPGEFIVSCSGTIGRLFQIPDGAPPGIINQALLKLRLDASRIEHGYFEAYFQWDHFQRKILDSTQGGAMQNLVGMPIFRKSLIALPPMAVQRAISSAVNDIGAEINALDRSISKKIAMKQGVMQQLLTGKSRLPGFTGPWTSRGLSDMLDYEQPGRYLVKTSKQLKFGAVPVLTAGKTFVLGYTNELHGIYTSLPAIIFDDFTTASKYVDFEFKAKSSAMKILHPKAGTNLRFVYERMQLVDFAFGDHKRHWISEYSKQELSVPSEPEQAAIAAVIADATLETEVLGERLAKAKCVKQGMMQELLTGRTCLPVGEAVS